MAHHDQLPSIDLDALEDVTGGVARSSSSSGTDPNVTAALQSITSSIKSISSQNANSGSSFQQLLPLLLLGRGGAGGGGGGACPCGCGMANCVRR